MTIPLFRTLYKIFPLSLCLTSSVHALSSDQELQKCKTALLAQVNEQRRVDVIGCPTAEKLVFWLGILRNADQFTPKELISFLGGHAHWPHYEKLCKKAEEVIINKASSGDVLAWFKNHPPQTPEGALMYAKALLSHQQQKKAEQVVEQAWQAMSLTKAQEKFFLTQFNSFLHEKNHIARLDFLLWEGNIEEAKRLLPNVSGDAQKLAHLRLAFLENKSNALQSMKSLSYRLTQNEGLLYEKAEWHRKRKEFKEAQQILMKAPIHGSHAQKWWKIQNYIARELIALREYGPAYNLLKRHKLVGGSESFSEAEWLLGWLSLRFLDQPDLSLKHFNTLYTQVKSAMSKSRSAYWLGRTYEKKGDLAQARKVYTKAAQYKTLYYGQLAAAKLKQKPFPVLASAPRATKEEQQKFEKNEFVKAAKILKGLGGTVEHELDKFLLHIAGQAKTRAERELSVQLTQKLSPHQVVWAAKKAGFSDPVLLKFAFPKLAIPRKGQEIPEISLVMAVAYQESRFISSAISQAGAMGLLQLIPRTAAQEAKRLGIPHNETKLLDPHHNLILGSAHLSKLLNDFMGSYILTFAAYNAGPIPVRRWLEEFGDPRQGDVDIIDWIELIPYYETRNYVMRVLENVSSYRSLFPHPKMTLVDDLKR